jgi:hypothetical protein
VGGKKEKKKTNGDGKGEQQQTQMQKTHTQRGEEKRERERERERMEGLRGARIFILITFIPHPHLIHFVNILCTNFVASSIFLHAF